MTFQSDIAKDVQKAAMGEMIFLYEIDLSNVSAGTVLYFTEGTKEDYTPIEFNSRTYQPIQMEAEGFDITGEGPMFLHMKICLVPSLHVEEL
jgi:lambda family phage minor tail protein L